MKANEISEIIGNIKKDIEARGGLKAVYFVGCGGSQAAIYPGFYCMQSEAKNIQTALYNSNEFVYAPPADLDKNCVVICCSLKATPETVVAVEKAKEAGAITIAMTGNMETGMAKVGEYVVVYSNGDNQIYSDSNQANALRLAFEILHQFEGYRFYEEAMQTFDKIDVTFENCKPNLEEAAKVFGQNYKNDDVFYVLGSGPLYGTAYTMCACHFMEMQWRHAVVLHSGEYFHGSFETTEEKTAMILLKSVGRTRPLDERVERFFEKHNSNYTVIDANDYGMGDWDENVAEFFNSILMIPIERYYVYQMSLVRNHSMDDRRYMWKEEY